MEVLARRWDGTALELEAGNGVHIRLRFDLGEMALDIETPTGILVGIDLPLQDVPALSEELERVHSTVMGRVWTEEDLLRERWPLEDLRARFRANGVPLKT